MEGVQETEGDDDVPDVDEKEEPDSQPGEMYELGSSILMCGDSTSEDDVVRLMGGNKADLALTDPPYNVAYEGKTKDKLRIKNDKMGDEPFLNFLRAAFTTMFGSLKAGGAFYIWHADLEGLNFRLAVKETGGKVRECLYGTKTVWSSDGRITSGSMNRVCTDGRMAEDMAGMGDVHRQPCWTARSQIEMRNTPQ